MKAIVAGLCLLAVVVTASVEPHTVFFTRKSIPKGWSKGARAPKDAAVNFMIALKQRNLDALDALFWAVVTPGSPRYQEYKTIDEILDIVAPEQTCHDTVKEWLHAAGIKHIKSTRDALEVKTSVAIAEALFKTEFHVFRHADKKSIVRAWGPMSMPKSVASYVDLVEGLSTFPIPHFSAKLASNNPNKANTPKDGTPVVIPQTMTQMYQIPAQSNGAHPETSVGVIEFQGQCYAPSDSVSYAQSVAITETPITAAHTIGPNDPTNPQLEAALDVEMIATMDNAAVAWFWLEDGQGWLYQYVNHYFNTPDVPQVCSISYGWSEADQCDIDPDECQQLGVDSTGYVLRVNAEFQKIALRGLTVLVASGDSGANGRTDPDCELPYLKPDYPAASPYITSVGATQVNNPQTNLNNPPPACNGQGWGCISGGTEVAVSYDQAMFASGGGFSNVAVMPDYQKAAVSAYLSNPKAQLPPASYFNATSRAYPDVAALGSNVLIYQGGLEPVGGTSCSSPEWAAVASILNQAVIAKTGKPLGFLNPWIYQVAAACPTCFHDITVGDNICTEDGCSPSCKGFHCTTGWDPVTGFGSPNVNALLAYIQNHM